MGFLQGKKLLITGVLSNRSIAYGIARACHREGAELAFTYVGERFHDRIVEFAKEFGSDICLEMDVTKDNQIANVMSELKERWGGLDGFVHSIGFQYISTAKMMRPLYPPDLIWCSCSVLGMVLLM